MSNSQANDQTKAQYGYCEQQKYHSASCLVLLASRMIQAMKSLVSLRDLGSSLKGIMLSIWMVWLSEVFIFLRQYSHRSRKHMLERMMKMQSRIEQRFTSPLPSAFRLPSHTCRTSWRAGRTQSWLASQICSVIWASGAMRYLEQTSQPLFSLLPTRSWHWVRLASGRPRKAQRLLKQTLLQMAATSCKWKLRISQLKDSRPYCAITPLWLISSLFVSSAKSVLPAEMLRLLIFSDRQSVLSMMMAQDVCFHCCSRKLKSLLKELVSTRMSTEKAREQRSSQRTLSEERSILLTSVSFLFLEINDFLALICSSISSSSFSFFFVEYSSRLSSSSSKGIPRWASSRRVANSLRNLSQWLPRQATQLTGMSRNQIMMSYRFLSMSSPMQIQQHIMPRAIAATPAASAHSYCNSNLAAPGWSRKAGKMAAMQLTKREAMESGEAGCWKQLSRRECSSTTASFRLRTTVRLFSSCRLTVRSVSKFTLWSELLAQSALQLAVGSIVAMMFFVSSEYSPHRCVVWWTQLVTRSTSNDARQSSRELRAKRRRRKRREARRRLITSTWLRFVLMAARNLAWQPSSSNLNSSRSSSPCPCAPVSEQSPSLPSAYTILISLSSSRIVLIFSRSVNRTCSSSWLFSSARCSMKSSMALRLSQSSSTPSSMDLPPRFSEDSSSKESSSRWACSLRAMLTRQPMCLSLTATIRSSSSSASALAPQLRALTASTCTTHSPRRPPITTSAAKPFARRNSCLAKSARPMSASEHRSGPSASWEAEACLRAVCARTLQSVTSPWRSASRTIFMLLAVLSLKTTCHSSSSGRCATEQLTDSRWLNLWFRNPSRSAPSASSRLPSPSRAHSCGATLLTSRSISSSRWQPVTSVNMRLAPTMRGRAAWEAGTARTRSGAVMRLQESSLKCMSSVRLEPDWRSRNILRALASISRPSAQSSLTSSRYLPQEQRISQEAELILQSSWQFSVMLQATEVICPPTWLSFLRSGTSSFSSAQNSFCSLADFTMASSSSATWFSKRMVSMRSESLSSRSSRFSRMIFLKRQILNCCWKVVSRRAAAENSSQARSLLRICSSWKKAQLTRSLVHSGNFFTPARNMRSTCRKTIWQLCSMPSSPRRRRPSPRSGQSASLHTSLCFSMQPISSMQLFLSLAWVTTSCSTQEMCASSCSPLLNFRFDANSAGRSAALSKYMISAKKGSPLIQITSAPSNPYPPSTCPTNSISAVQKQYVEQILKNFEAVLLQCGFLTAQHQNCQKAKKKMTVTQKAVPSKGLKVKMNCSTILLMMNTTSPLELVRAVSFPIVMRGSNSASATTVEISTNRNENSSVMQVWKRCQPVQHCTSGKLVITHPSPASPCSHCTTFSSVSVIGRKSTVTNSGTTCANTTSGKVKRNFFFEKEQLTQTMSTRISRMMKMSPYSITRNAPNGAPGRYVPMLNWLNNCAKELRLLPPFQALITSRWKGKASICRQSSPVSKASPRSDYSSSSSDFLSRITKSTLKIASLKSVHACRMPLRSSRPMSELTRSDSSIAIYLNRALIALHPIHHTIYPYKSHLRHKFSQIHQWLLAGQRPI